MSDLESQQVAKPIYLSPYKDFIVVGITLLLFIIGTIATVPIIGGLMTLVLGIF